MYERHAIKYLAPGWFAVIMGTGGLANILKRWQPVIPSAYFLSLLFAALAAIMYFLVLVPWVIRWIWFYEYALRELRHPVTGNFFVTMPVATIIIGTNLNSIWSEFLGGLLTYRLAGLAWVLGVLGVTFFSFYSTFRIMQVEAAPQPETTNFSWIMAPIANMATLLLGNSIVSMSVNFEPTWSMTILMVNTVMFGIGFFLFLFISAVIFVRLVQHPLPPVELTPSFGILLSAVGLSVIGVIDTALNARSLGVVASIDLANLGAAIIWGFGVWVIGIIVMIAIYHIQRGGIPFSLGWWAFIFPLAAYTIASQKIALIYLTPLTFWYSALLTLVLILLWGYVFFNTLRGVLSGKLFMGIPISKSS